MEGSCNGSGLHIKYIQTAVIYVYNYQLIESCGKLDVVYETFSFRYQINV